MKIILVFLILFAALVIFALSFDFVPWLKTIYGRRGIGSLGGGEAFLKAAKAIVSRWLLKGVPVVPRVADKRLTIIERAKGTYKPKAIQSWQEAAVLLAANELELEEAKAFIYKKIDKQTGRWLQPPSKVDEAYFAFAALCSPKIEKDFLKAAMDETAELLLEKYRAFSGIPYSENQDLRFVDTIGLVCPFLMKYSIVYNNDEAMEAAISLIEEYAENGIHKSSGLPVHCFNVKTKAPIGIFAWGRGCGWWASGLIDCYRTLSKTDNDSFIREKMIVLKNMLLFAENVINYQNENGAFCRNLFINNGEDSSATAMLAMFLAYTGRVSNQNELIKAAKKAMQYIYSCTRRNGVVDYSQGDTMGIGFYSQASIVLPATQGFAVKAYMELEKRG